MSSGGPVATKNPLSVGIGFGIERGVVAKQLQENLNEWREGKCIRAYAMI